MANIQDAPQRCLPVLGQCCSGISFDDRDGTVKIPILHIWAGLHYTKMPVLTLSAMDGKKVFF